MKKHNENILYLYCIAANEKVFDQTQTLEMVFEKASRSLRCKVSFHLFEVYDASTIISLVPKRERHLNVFKYNFVSLGYLVRSRTLLFAEVYRVGIAIRIDGRTRWITLFGRK